MNRLIEPIRYNKHYGFFFYADTRFIGLPIVEVNILVRSIVKQKLRDNFGVYKVSLTVDVNAEYLKHSNFSQWA
jgi:hypothetical protein